MEVIMNNLLTQKEWKDILAKVYKRAAIDHDFYELCLRDAHEAIKQASGKDLPRSQKIRFVDETEELVFMLPEENKNRNKKLSDSELEALAGGMSLFSTSLLPRSSSSAL